MAIDLEYDLAQARRIAEHREEGAEKKIRKLYRSMLKDLQHFVADTYTKYAQDDKLTFAMLQQAGYNARFLEEIERRIGVATPKAAKEIRQLVSDTYKIAYDGMVEAVVNGGGLDAAFAAAVSITPQQIKNAVQNPLMDVALEKNHRDIIYDIKQVVAIGLMNGDRYTDMARRLSDKVDDGIFYKSVRIARTEAHRVREAGNMDAAVEADKELQNTDTGLRMVKIWKTMKDELVRPQRRRKGKKGWSTKMGKGANHMKLEGQTVLVDEPFDLLDGYTAMTPGQSGVAGHDINCRCYASFEMMTDAEFFAKTGRHFPGMKIKNQSVIQSGGKHYIPSDPEDKKSVAASKAYRKISRRNDIRRISDNSGFSVKDISQIRRHIFFEKHDLYDGYGLFDADYDIAVAWERLYNGNFFDRDITLLNHELLESKLERQYNIPVSEAHRRANDEYNWEKQIENELGEEGEKYGSLQI